MFLLFINDTANVDISGGICLFSDDMSFIRSNPDITLLHRTESNISKTKVLSLNFLWFIVDNSLSWNSHTDWHFNKSIKFCLFYQLSVGYFCLYLVSPPAIPRSLTRSSDTISRLKSKEKQATTSNRVSLQECISIGIYSQNPSVFAASFSCSNEEGTNILCHSLYGATVTL